MELKMQAMLSLLLFAILAHSVHAEPLVPLFQVVTEDLMCLAFDSGNGFFRKCSRVLSVLYGLLTKIPVPHSSPMFQWRIQSSD